MLCLLCYLQFPEQLTKCPQCGGELVKERRQKERRKGIDEQTGRERRESERRKQLIKRYEEVFLRGAAKNN